MSTLHTVNKSPFATGSLLSCLAHCRDGDAVLMMEDGVYGALTDTGVASQVAEKVGGVSIYVLKSDTDARGLAEDRLIEGIESVDYDGFVDLVAGTDRTQSWL